MIRAVLLLTALASLAAPAGAGAVGELTYDGCMAGTVVNGCTNVPGSPLRSARGLAVSPDGSSVYVASQDSNSVSHFFAQRPGGQLKWDDCLANDASDGCGDVPEAPLDGALDVTVSPDGGSVYVASFVSSTVSRLAVQKPGGQLKWVECLARTAGPCGDIDFPVLNSPRGVVVSPDGGRLYVPSFNSDSISPMILDKPSGQLVWPGCLADDASQGCGDLPGNPLNGAAAAAVSPDGSSLYVVSGIANTISHFFVKPGGDLVYDGCLGNDATEGCGDLPGTPLIDPTAVAVSPDGGSVYVASSDSGSVSHFVVQKPGDQLTWEGCLGDDASHGCVDVPGDPLLSPDGITVSPDGDSVYVTAADSGSLSHLLVQKPGGQLVWRGCLGNDGSLGCTDLPGAPLALPSGVAVSPDGGSVYTAGNSGVAHFFRVGEPAPGGGGGGSPDGGAEPGITPAVAPRFLSARLSHRVFAVDPKGAAEKVVKASAKGTTFSYSLTKDARVLFRIERAAAGRRVGHSCRRPSRRNRRARPCTRYVKVGAFAQTGVAGANLKKWSGKLGRRGLKPGRYRATLIATNPGVTASGPRRLGFTIVRS